MLLSWAAAGCTKPDPEQPNLILVVTDDHGWADLGSQGVAKDVKTPHLDALAAEGVRFTRGYVTAPQCVPSRAGFLTGRSQTRFGIETNRSGALPLSERTIADRLRAAGYRTGLVGKWQLDGGMGGELAPGRRGFDEYFEGSRSLYQASFDLAGVELPDAPRTLREERYRVDVQTDAAIAFLERRRSESGQPFFLYLAYSAPHVPLNSPGRYVTRFRDVPDKTRRAGLASLAAIDDGVGRIRDFLREHDLEKKTLLFVFSDNGAPIKRDRWNGSLNLPLVGEKGMLTDGGIRVPFFAVWKGVLPAGRVEPRAVSALDVAATALALADAEAGAELDGVDLLPFLAGGVAAAPHEFLYWRWRSQAAIFDGRWKLLFLAPDQWLLFDHSSDAPETDDVAARHPEVVARLRAQLEAWASEQSPPGLPRDLDRRDRRLYGPHIKLSEAPPASPPAGG